MTDAFYITTPIYYVNDNPHIGHAYTTIACDVIARFMRLDGRPVRFLTGTDEHGQKVEKSAQNHGEAPQAFCNRVSQRFRQLAEALDISNDDFIRTTEDRHVRATQAIWQRMAEAGDIYLGSYSGWYAVRDEAFYGEDELTVDAAGNRVAPSGAPVEWVEEPSYFFRLSAWAERLLAFYEANPGFIAPESRRNEVMSFVRGGLRDLSISRTTYKWGVPVPGDPDHVMYVWLDALTNYITAIGYPDTDDPLYRTFWPADLHVIGKDILRFHTVYWPAFLMSAGLEPPKRVFAHGWWTNEGQKISKSLGNVIDPFELIDTFGLDQTRYFLMREVPFGNDGDFSRRAVVMRINGELANGFGNLGLRTLSFIARNCGGSLPEPGALAEADRQLLAQAEACMGGMRNAMGRQAVHQALQYWNDLVSAANKYIDDQAPWALRKSDPGRMGTVLWVLADTIRQIAILAQPFVPAAAARQLDQLAVPADARGFDRIGAAGALAGGTALPKPEGVFPRVELPDEEAGAQG
ncbi:methionine--tRNA ligase [Marinibaculum pumilum]|uniref:Methionine--tRNA ligase n=1 Tax=Marinibaculum pumilum TaxID=1766165 RepID=A0ABV7KU90_9PROT